MVEAYRRALLSQVSRDMVGRALRSLRAIIDEAMRNGLIGQNVATAVRMPSASRKARTISIPSKLALRSMLKHAELSSNPIVLPFFSLLIFTGMRASELRGLSWNDVDLAKSTVRICKRADAKGVMGLPKSNAGYRVIPLPPLATKALREWKLRCPRTDLSLVLPSLSGKVMSHGYMTSRLLNPIQKLASDTAITEGAAQPGTEFRYTLHCFRHAAASLWIEQRLSPKRVQTLMGHSSITMTFDVYGHLFEETESQASTAQAMEASIFGRAT